MIGNQRNPGDPPEIDGPNQEEPYYIEVDNNGCPHCGAGRTWTVIDPNGYGSGTSYGQVEDAEEMAEDLNTAYNRGKLNSRPWVKNLEIRTFSPKYIRMLKKRMQDKDKS